MKFMQSVAKSGGRFYPIIKIWLFIKGLSPVKGREGDLPIELHG